MTRLRDIRLSDKKESSDWSCTIQLIPPGASLFLLRSLAGPVMVSRLSDWDGLWANPKATPGRGGIKANLDFRTYRTAGSPEDEPLQAVKALQQ